MKGITVRVGDSTYEMLREEARREGVGMTAFIREAAIIRATILRVRRGEYGPPGEDFGLTEAVRAYLEHERRVRLGERA